MKMRRRAPLCGPDYGRAFRRAASSCAWPPVTTELGRQDEAFGLVHRRAGTHRVSSPSTYENALSVASVDNVGFVSEYESLFISASGDAFEPAVEKTPTACSGSGRAWTRPGKAPPVVFWRSLQPLCRQTQTDERIYAASAQDFAGFDFTGKVVLTARETRSCLRTRHQNAQAGAAAALIYNKRRRSTPPSRAPPPPSPAAACPWKTPRPSSPCARRTRPAYYLHPRHQRPPREQRRRREVPHHERLLLLGARPTTSPSSRNHCPGGNIYRSTAC